MTRPKVVWASGLNLAGLYSKKPIRCSWKGDGWWDSEGDFDVRKLGLDRGSMTVFASADIAQVKAWIAGVTATMDCLKEWAGVDPS